MTEAEAIAIAIAEAEGNETPAEAFARTGTPTAQVDQQLRPEMARPVGTTAAGPVQQPQQPEVAPYDWSVMGAPLPKAFQPVGDLIAGMNSSLASLAGIALDDVDIIMRDLGMSGLMDRPGDGKASVIKALEAAGIGADKTKAASKFLGDMGESVGENLLMLSAFMAAAPMMMAAEGGGAFATFQRNLGKALVQQPGTAAVAEIGAGMGAETGAAAGRQIGPTAEALGGMTGALGGGLLGMLPGAGLGKGIASGFKGVRDMVRTGAAAAGEPPLLTQTTPDMTLIPKAIQSDQLKVDRIIENLSSRLTGTADPIESTRQLQRVQREAYARARPIEASYWKEVNLQRKLSSAGLKQFGANLVKATAKEGRTEWLPQDILAKIKGLPQNVTMERMRAIRTIVFQRLQSGTVPTAQGVLPMNDTMRRNMNSMIAEIDSQIDNAFPNDLELKKATQFTKWLHDRFTRGPIAQFARPRAKEGTLPRAGTAARGALQDERFGPQTADIGQQLNMPEVEAAATQFLQGQLTDEVSKRGPEGAANWLKQPHVKAFIEAYPKMAADFATTTSRLDRALQTRKTVFESSFIKATNEAPETAINRIITSKNKVNDAKMLRARLQYDPDAMEAAKNQTILELERIAGGDPSKILTILDSPDTRNAVKLILGDDLNRLERIARDATQLMQVQEGMPRYLLQRGGRVIGAFLARRLNTGTLQAPEIGGRLAQKLVDDWLGRTERDIFAKAVRYPAWEAVLKAKLPHSVNEMEHLKTLLRRAIRVEEATERSLVNVPQAIEDNLNDE